LVLVLVLVLVVVLLRFWVVGIVGLDVGECWIMNDVWPPTSIRTFIIYYLLFLSILTDHTATTVIIQHLNQAKQYQQCKCIPSTPPSMYALPLGLNAEKNPAV
jgi:hypothetical protein